MFYTNLIIELFRKFIFDKSDTSDIKVFQVEIKSRNFLTR